MKILHVTTSLAYSWGGPPRVVVPLAEAVVKRGIQCAIVSPDFPIDEPKLSSEIVDIKLFKVGWLANYWKGYSLSLVEGLYEVAKNFDIIHIHELWHFPNIAAYMVAKALGKPYGITIHGALEPWCLKQKALSKKIYAALLQKRILREAAFLHVITSAELNHVCEFVENSRVFIIPNGVCLDELGNSDWGQDEIALLKDKRVILFLGRINRVKGLDLLAKSFSELVKIIDNVWLIIAGPDNGYLVQLKNLLRSLKLLRRTYLPGMLLRDKVLYFLKVSDVLVVPSYSEVRSLVALEAMAYATPVVITKQCNFSEISESNAGIILDSDPDKFALALRELLCNPKQKTIMGLNGQRVALDRFAWDSVADKMIAIYCRALERHKEGK